jgi:hypothetical protein
MARQRRMQIGQSAHLGTHIGGKEDMGTYAHKGNYRAGISRK